MNDFWLDQVCLIILRGQASGHSGNKMSHAYVIWIIQVIVMQPLNILLMKESTIKLRVDIRLFWSSVISGSDL